MSVLASSELGLSTVDPDVARLIDEEASRQSGTICLIPSENYVSRAVLEALGSVFTNKYSEGYPGRRYYEGQQVVDQLEPLAVDRPGGCLGSSTRMSSRTRGRRRTSRSTSRTWIRVTR